MMPRIAAKSCRADRKIGERRHDEREQRQMGERKTPRRDIGQAGDVEVDLGKDHRRGEQQERRDRQDAARTDGGARQAGRQPSSRWKSAPMLANPVTIGGVQAANPTGSAACRPSA